MTIKRFNNLPILSIHKELVDSINLVDIGNEFSSNPLPTPKIVLTMSPLPIILIVNLSAKSNQNSIE